MKLTYKIGGSIGAAVGGLAGANLSLAQDSESGPVAFFMNTLIGACIWGAVGIGVGAIVYWIGHRREGAPPENQDATPPLVGPPSADQHHYPEHQAGSAARPAVVSHDAAVEIVTAKLVKNPLIWLVIGLGVLVLILTAGLVAVVSNDDDQTAGTKASGVQTARAAVPTTEAPTTTTEVPMSEGQVTRLALAVAMCDHVGYDTRVGVDWCQVPWDGSHVQSLVELTCGTINLTDPYGTMSVDELNAHFLGQLADLRASGGLDLDQAMDLAYALGAVGGSREVLC